MGESTRPLPSLIPLTNGGWEVKSLMSSADFTIRGLGLLPPNSVIPVIVVPGIMGTNLRARRQPRLGRKRDERNDLAGSGQPVWRPPNGKPQGLRDAYNWDRRSPKDRQLLFDSATLEVDEEGPIVLPSPEDGYVFTNDDVRLRGWGELHADSYSGLLYALQTRLNQTFGFNEISKTRFIKPHWTKLMRLGPKVGGMNVEPLTESHLEKHAQHYFPAYAVGYNWLEDCATSSLRLEQRIVEIIESWKNAKRTCNKVILVTHSMGGLVARACAKRIPDKIAGVIHGVMPALGAPAAYRRLACGTEAFSPSNGAMDDLSGFAIAKILGDTPEKTTPVLATAAGALELLPNHLYPQPWLHIRVMMSAGIQPSTHGGRGDTVRQRQSPVDYLHMPSAKVSNPYDLYRDMKSWYRMIDPLLADPAGLYRRQAGGVENIIKLALGAAEKFHRSLGEYYHPNTYAFYGIDPAKLAYGQLCWSAPQRMGTSLALTPANVAAAKAVRSVPGGTRRVIVEGKSELQFAPEPQDSAGDGTVPHQSGGGPAGKIKQVFATRGYDHQGAYNDEQMLMLTLRLIVRIVQELP